MNIHQCVLESTVEQVVSPATNFGTAIDEHIGPHKVTRLSLHLKDTVSDSVFSYKTK